MEEYVLAKSDLETVDNNINGLEEEIRGYLEEDDENEKNYYYEIILRKHIPIDTNKD